MHHITSPYLVFLHGLLGSAEDWATIRQLIPNIPTLALDLPSHGWRNAIQVNNFQQCCADIYQQIQQQIGNADYYLVGYSLGGRLALYYALQASLDKSHLKGIILEGANLGLNTENERQQRWQQDQYWVARFQHQEIENVLNDWYQQPVFAHLTSEQRLTLIEKRKHNNGKSIANILASTSLAKQPNFAPLMSSQHLPIAYIVGEQDKKFRQLAKQSQLSYQIIPQAGHNSHLENPTAFAQVLQSIYVDYAKKL